MYKLIISDTAQERLNSFPPKIFKQVLSKVISLSKNPRPQDYKKLAGREAYRVDSGEYRIIYTIDDKNQLIEIWEIIHRKDAYR